MNNDYLMLLSNLESNRINVNLFVLIDINVINYAFINDSFAQRHSLLCFSLFETCTLQRFNDQLVIFELITYYAFVKLQVSRKELKETLFFVIQLLQFSIVLNLL